MIKLNQEFKNAEIIEINKENLSSFQSFLDSLNNYKSEEDNTNQEK